MAVIGAIGGELRDRIVELIEQRREDLTVANAVGRHERRHDLVEVGVHAKVDLAPGSAFAVAVLAYLPFSLAEDLEAGRIHHHVEAFFPRRRARGWPPRAAVAAGTPDCSSVP